MKKNNTYRSEKHYASKREFAILRGKLWRSEVETNLIFFISTIFSLEYYAYLAQQRTTS